MSRKELTWEDVKKELSFTPEELEEIRLEEEIIEATINIRKSAQLTQRDLSKISGIKQPAIARLESNAVSPQILTLIKLLYPMGYTLKVVPLGERKK
ncbi:MAG: helix-turn-helix transcriptional regulator [Clostridia bacterium]|nr:helix-turn-helix transcriptional regulator [Clostridia bacterium]